MKLKTVSPTKSIIVSCDLWEAELLQKGLTYINTSTKHLIKRHSQNYFWKSRNHDSWQQHLEELKKNLKNTLVFTDDNGQNYIRPGSIPYILEDLFPDLEVEDGIKYPTLSPVPWLKPLPFNLHHYQDQSWKKLIMQRHGNVSICTGGGKSAIILKLCQQTGLNTVVVVPSKSIFLELVEKFEHHFGKKHVGTFGAGKKKLGKKFTIAIGDSLVNIKPDTEEFKFFSSLQSMICDESHTLPSETLEQVCHGVLSEVPYRFFLSATQIRGDGSTPLLQSIIGKTVCELSTKEAIEKGYICTHDYRIISVQSSNPTFDAADPLAQKRVHFLNNKNIAQFIARLANAMANSQGKQTLVLCEELSQLAMLAPLLTVPYALAHSEKRKDRLEELGLPKVDVTESIEKFNKNEVKVLITTSCCHVGVNLYPTHSTCNWVGGSSEIKTKQSSIGRSVRHGHSNPWADRCVSKLKATIYDFQILNQPTMQRHLDARIRFYEDSGTEIRFVKIKQ